MERRTVEEVHIVVEEEILVDAGRLGIEVAFVEGGAVGVFSVVVGVGGESDFEGGGQLVVLVMLLHLNDNIL